MARPRSMPSMSSRVAEPLADRVVIEMVATR
jgi:hypothetical protein